MVVLPAPKAPKSSIQGPCKEARNGKSPVDKFSVQYVCCSTELKGSSPKVKRASVRKVFFQEAKRC